MIWTLNRSLGGQQGISSPVSLLTGLLAGLFSHLSLEVILQPFDFKIYMFGSWVPPVHDMYKQYKQHVFLLIHVVCTYHDISHDRRTVVFEYVNTTDVEICCLLWNDPMLWKMYFPGRVKRLAPWSHHTMAPMPTVPVLIKDSVSFWMSASKKKHVEISEPEIC